MKPTTRPELVVFSAIVKHMTTRMKPSYDGPVVKTSLGFESIDVDPDALARLRTLQGAKAGVQVTVVLADEKAGT